MGWFDEQVKERIRSDDEDFSNAFANLSESILGKSILEKTDGAKCRDEIERVLTYYNIPSVEVPKELKDIDSQLDYLISLSGVMRRTVELKEQWWKFAIGAMLVKFSDGTVKALMPSKISGYYFYENGKKIKVNALVAKTFESEALCFYPSLPLRKIGIKDLLVFAFKANNKASIILYGIVAMLVVFIGMLAPMLNNLLFGKIAPSQELTLILPFCVLFLSVSVSTILIKMFKKLLLERLMGKIDIYTESAAMMRLLSLPVSFFKNYETGELVSRLYSLSHLVQVILNAIFSVGFTSIFSLIYLGQIFIYTPALVVPALVIILATLIWSLASTFLNVKISEKMMLYASKNGIYNLLTGIQKIKLAGAEKRAFAKWAGNYSKQAKMEFNPPWYLKAAPVISSAISAIGMIAIFYFAVVSKVSVGNYMAFYSAYGMLMGAFMTLSGMVNVFASIKPTYNMAKPFLDETPEISARKQVITKLSGAIELNNISFRYTESSPLVLDDLSLKIRCGQYVAIVGKTGCGKSTLLRLMLGFEKAQRGTVYYDGKDIQTLDLKSLRSKIGVVMQDGKLFQGDIFSNIAISAPNLNVEGAWAAAEVVGIANDIKAMPMGMNTIISEGSGGVSGGQRQRIILARAIAANPKIVMLDEATSALDNLTQKIVSDNLEKLKCTRIVIAHRLSTIKKCNRIIVLDKGKIVEDGTYEELIGKNGIFARLVERQR